MLLDSHLTFLKTLLRRKQLWWSAGRQKQAADVIQLFSITVMLTVQGEMANIVIRSGRHKALVTKANHRYSMTKQDFLGRVSPSANCFVALPLLRPKRGGRGPWVTGQGLYMRHYVILPWPGFTLLPRCLSAHLCNSRDDTVRLDACAKP